MAKVEQNRETLAEWFFNNESNEQEASDAKHKRIPQGYARWPEDAAIQPYCHWAYKRADAFLAHFGVASHAPDSEPTACPTCRSTDKSIRNTMMRTDIPVRGPMPFVCGNAWHDSGAIHPHCMGSKFEK